MAEGSQNILSIETFFTLPLMPSTHLFIGQAKPKILNLVGFKKIIYFVFIKIGVLKNNNNLIKSNYFNINNFLC